MLLFKKGWEWKENSQEVSAGEESFLKWESIKDAQFETLVYN